MTPEETRALEYLRSHKSPSLTEIARACLARAADMEWVDRVVANLNWLGYVAVYPGANGTPAALQITQKGLAHAVARIRPRQEAGR